MHPATRRITRYLLELIAAGLVVLTPAGCGLDLSGTLGSDVTPAPDDSGDGTTDPGGGDQSPPPTEDPGDPADPPADGDEPIPDNEYCRPVADWSAAWDQFEDRVLVLINEHRAAGADCGSGGVFPATHPLADDGALRCAARNHSMDMALRDFLSHTNPDGDGPAERIERAGYEWWTWGENIAWWYPTPEDVVAGWMSSPGHCANIMRGSFTEVGVGYYDGDGALWTLAFGAPRP